MRRTLTMCFVRVSGTVGSGATSERAQSHKGGHHCRTAHAPILSHDAVLQQRWVVRMSTTDSRPIPHVFHPTQELKRHVYES
jgi:hypothetical protein